MLSRNEVLGDVTTWAGCDIAPCLLGSPGILEEADVMSIGFPCKDWSPMGKRRGWQGESKRCLDGVQEVVPRLNLWSQQCFNTGPMRFSMIY